LSQKKLPTSNYKGTRDFYPEDMKIRNWMFSQMKSVVQSFGYEEYDGPILESIDLYKAKSGQEIVEKQLYDFIDKGNRHVTIRPEMTPTLARMVAARLRDLPKPIRWFSIPNLWRYEAPGHGRLREHWQLNVDIFGVNSLRAELEILHLAYSILIKLGAKKEHFLVKISHRGILSGFLKNTLGLSADLEQAVAKILDKKNKISIEEFKSSLGEILPDPKNQLDTIIKYLDADLEGLKNFNGIPKNVIDEIEILFKNLYDLGISENIHFDPSIIRGFDYYTGVIFEIFDTDPKNKRSLYGGGRYDNLIGIFSNDSLSGLGFGLGDVTLENFLRTHDLIPQMNKNADFYIPLMDDKIFMEIVGLADELRNAGWKAEISLEAQKLGKQFQIAEKKGYRYILLMGIDEIQKNEIVLKDLQSSNQTIFSRSNFIDQLSGAFHFD
jgi:histidyl-tRNA synthetase